LGPVLIEFFPGRLEEREGPGDRISLFMVARPNGYSWLLVLMIYNPFHAVRYLSLRSTSDPNNKRANAGMFKGYYNDLQENIANTWRITPEVVTPYQGIAIFKVIKHTM
jgi:hypothetical protein